MISDMENLGLEELKKIKTQFDRILEEHSDISAVEELLNRYQCLPDFVLPFFKAVYYKHFNEWNKSVCEIDRAVHLADDISIIFGLCDRFYRKLWPQAGEIYAHSNRYTDSVNAYNRYCAMQFNIKTDDDCGNLLSFRPISKCSLMDIINKEITVSHPKVMNDPFDTIYLQWLDYYCQNNDKGRKHIKPMLEAMGNVRIRCFVNNQLDVTDSEPVSNILMWSHYADSHRGMCLEYQFSNKFMNQTSDDAVLHFRKVNYGPDALSIKSEQMMTDIGLLRKCNAWEYENEVRLISFAPDRKENFIPIKLDEDSCILRVFFGMNCPKRDIDTVRSILSDGKTKFYQMEKDWNNIYHLKYQEI